MARRQPKQHNLVDARQFYQAHKEPDLMARIRRGHSVRRRKDQWATVDRMFERGRYLRKAGKIRGFGGPCPCGRNHKAVRINGEELCPIRLYMWICQLANYGNQRWQEWKQEHGIEDLIERLDTSEDATYVEEDE